MHLVVDQMIELHHVHVAHGRGPVEALAGPAVIELRLATERQTGQLQQLEDLLLAGTVEYRRSHWHAAPQVAGQFLDLVVVEVGQLDLLAAGLVVDLIHEPALFGRRRVRVDHAPIFRPRPLAAHPRWVSSTWPTFMRDGTPSGFRTMSTGVPSARYGMSSTGTMVEITPLLPCRPAILSPGWMRRFTAR